MRELVALLASGLWPGLKSKDKGRRKRAFQLYSSVAIGGERRRMVRTQDGAPALCPETTQVGDRVALLFGAQVPFVIRPLWNGNFSLVGECYRDGVMYGELMPEIANSKHPVLEITLRGGQLHLEGCDLVSHRAHIGDQRRTCLG